MSQSLENYIGFMDLPKEKYGKIMSISDNIILDYFKLVTRISLGEVQEIENAIKENKVNPRDLKMKLAKEIVTIYDGKSKAIKAEEEFINVFKNKENPEDMKEFKIKEDKKKLIDIISESGLTSSKGEARRLIEQGAVKIDSESEKGWDKEVEVKDGMVIQAGKRKFIKIVK